jgi:hypothetical protein
VHEVKRVARRKVLSQHHRRDYVLHLGGLGKSVCENPVGGGDLERNVLLHFHLLGAALGTTRPVPLPG